MGGPFDIGGLRLRQHSERSDGARIGTPEKEWGMRISRKTSLVPFAVVAVAAALFIPSASAKGPSPKASLTASSTCLLSASVSWKNLTVTEVVWTLDENGVQRTGGFSQGLGALSSPQTAAWPLPGSGTASAFTVTAQLLDGSTQVGVATSRSISANCA